MLKFIFLILFSVVIIFFSSCKSQVFLQKKYFKGAHFKTVKIKTPETIFCSKNNEVKKERYSDHKMGEVILEKVYSEPSINLVQSKKPETYKSSVKHKHGQKKAVKNFKTLDLSRVHHSTKQMPKKEGESKSDLPLKALLSVIILWIAVILIYPNNIIVELASVLITLKLLAYILIAVIIWLIVWGLLYLINRYSRNH